MTLFTHNPGGLQQLEIPNAAHSRLVELLKQWASQRQQAVFLTEQILLEQLEPVAVGDQALEVGGLEASYLEAGYEDAEADGLGHGSQFNLKRLAAAEALEQQCRPEPSLDSACGFALLLMEGFALLLQQGIPSQASRSGLERLASYVPDAGHAVQPNIQAETTTLGLTFEPAAIEAFAQELLIRPMAAGYRQGLTDWLALPQEPNRPELQGHFTLLLLQQLSATDASARPKTDSTPDSVFGPTAGMASAEAMPIPQLPQLRNELNSHASALRQAEPGGRSVTPSFESIQTPSSLRIQELTRELQEAWETAHAAEQAKTEFLAMMSHELRTPLTCVIGMSATMLRWSFGELSDRQRDYLQSINDSGEHLLQLIESILDFSQVESGQAKLQMRHFSLRRLVSYCVQLFEEAAEHSALRLETVFALTPEEDEFVADPQRLRQILINLLDNAIKFTPAGGQISLRVASQDGGVLFQVTDTGIGIEPLQQSLLFERFQQLDRTHQRRYQGSGLGLALTKHQVDLHQGTIKVESAPGQGSAFNVWLPAQRLPTPLPVGKLQGTVVLLEDDDQSAALLCELLTASGFKVVWLVESSTALEQILELQPLAAIVDLEIQGGSGDEIIRHIHQASFDHRPKVIALSSLAEGTQEFPLPEDPMCQADAYLFRPIQPEVFVSRLQSLVAEAA